MHSVDFRFDSPYVSSTSSCRNSFREFRQAREKTCGTNLDYSQKDGYDRTGDRGEVRERNGGSIA